MADPVDPTIQRQQLLAQALKDKVPLAAQDPTSGTYDDLDSAAKAFYGGMGQYDHKIENAGVVYSDTDGKYHYSIPTVQQDDGFKLRAAGKLAALFHNHPGNDADAGHFSSNDLQVADQLKVPSYVYFEGLHDMRKYTPGITKTQNKMVNYKLQKISDGDEVAKQQALVAALRDPTP